MFGKKHYIPILKWKSAEIRALKDLHDRDRKNLTPLIEFVLPKVSSLYKDKATKTKKTADEILAEVVHKFKSKRLSEIPEEIRDSWGTSPIFVDFTLLHEAQYTTRLKVESMKKILSAGEQLGLGLIPVINLNDDEKLKQTASQLSAINGKGLCLRITSVDLSDTNTLNRKIEDFLGSLSLDERVVDLLFDIKNKGIEDGHYSRYVSQTQKVTKLNRWRNIIFASGAFPEDLQGCKFGEETYIRRSDWMSWLQHIFHQPLKRAATFADYTIRNPIYKEATQVYAPTTSIRYTIENDWMILKGKKLKYDLYLANAKLLVEESGNYAGPRFSAGDLFISEKAKHYVTYIKNPKVKGTGGSEDWIYAGINHHLVLAARQIANLP